LLIAVLGFRDGALARWLAVTELCQGFRTGSRVFQAAFLTVW
jgi:hypothetical protein